MDRIWFIKSKDMFKRSLKRGVCYHHAGLNNKKRSCVEILFRERYLQVRFQQWDRNRLPWWPVEHFKLKVVQNSFQQLDFDESLSPLFIT